MALIVEDATGLATAESYLSYIDYVAYWFARGVTTTADAGTPNEAATEAKLRLTTEYIDLRWGSSAPGFPINEDQALCFPTDFFITSPAALPIQLKRATAEYLRYSLTNSLFIDNDRSGGPGIKILKEKVGPIETETRYSGSGLGSVGAKYPIVIKADTLMRQITNSGQGGVYR